MKMISLTDYLIKKYGYTKSRIKKLYKYKEVYVNDKLVKYDTDINHNLNEGKVKCIGVSNYDRRGKGSS